MCISGIFEVPSGLAMSAAVVPEGREKIPFPLQLEGDRTSSYQCLYDKKNVSPDLCRRQTQLQVTPEDQVISFPTEKLMLVTKVDRE